MNNRITLLTLVIFCGGVLTGSRLSKPHPASDGLAMATHPAGPLSQLAVHLFTPKTPGQPIQSDLILFAAEPSLYFGCGNDLRVYLHQNGRLYTPEFSSDASGEILPSPSNPSLLRVIPHGRTFSFPAIKGLSGEILNVSTPDFKVIQPPRPALELWANGRQIPPGFGTPISPKSSFQLKIQPDPAFRNALPRDARYYLTELSILAQNRLGAPELLQTLSGEGIDALNGVDFDLGERGHALTPGTRIFIQIKSIYRLNFQNRKLPVSDYTCEFFGFVLK